MLASVSYLRIVFFGFVTNSIKSVASSETGPKVCLLHRAAGTSSTPLDIGNPSNSSLSEGISGTVILGFRVCLFKNALSVA